MFRPDGTPFISFVELGTLQERTAEQLAQARQQAEAEGRRAERERLAAEGERQRAERLAARLRELGIDLDAV